MQEVSFVIVVALINNWFIREARGKFGELERCVRVALAS